MSASEPQTLYDLLGVPPQATNVELRAGFLRLAQQFHPDLNREQSAADRRFKQIRLAYEILSDPVRRAVYDEDPHRYRISETEIMMSWDRPVYSAGAASHQGWTSYPSQSSSPFADQASPYSKYRPPVGKWTGPAWRSDGRRERERTWFGIGLIATVLFLSVIPFWLHEQQQSDLARANQPVNRSRQEAIPAHVSNQAEIPPPDSEGLTDKTSQPETARQDASSWGSENHRGASLAALKSDENADHWPTNPAAPSPFADMESRFTREQEFPPGPSFRWPVLESSQLTPAPWKPGPNPPTNELAVPRTALPAPWVLPPALPFLSPDLLLSGNHSQQSLEQAAASISRGGPNTLDFPDISHAARPLWNRSEVSAVTLPQVELPPLPLPASPIPTITPATGPGEPPSVVNAIPQVTGANSFESPRLGLSGVPSQTVPAPTHAWAPQATTARRRLHMLGEQYPALRGSEISRPRPLPHAMASPITSPLGADREWETAPRSFSPWQSFEATTKSSRQFGNSAAPASDWP